MQHNALDISCTKATQFQFFTILNFSFNQLSDIPMDKKPSDQTNLSNTFDKISSFFAYVLLAI